MASRAAPTLAAVAVWLDRTLRVREIPDKSLNGLQVDGPGRVRKVAAAVDACEASCAAAADWGADLLIVHHGLFWGAPEPVTGLLRRRLARLFAGPTALYAAHLPLDLHSRLGNNARLAAALGLRSRVPFGDYHGVRIGVGGNLPAPATITALTSRLGRLFGVVPRVFDHGRARIRRLALVSGGAGDMVFQAAHKGFDALLTGEASHPDVLAARELGVHLILAGHYVTETFGVRALAGSLGKFYDLPVRFFDFPTGM